MGANSFTATLAPMNESRHATPKHARSPQTRRCDGVLGAIRPAALPVWNGGGTRGGLTGESGAMCVTCASDRPPPGMKGGGQAVRWMALKARVFLDRAGNIVGDVGNYNLIRDV